MVSIGDSDVDVTLETLEVEEGAQKAITNKYLDIRADDIKSFIYNVTRGPKHGRLDVLAPNKVKNPYRKILKNN